MFRGNFAVSIGPLLNVLVGEVLLVNLDHVVGGLLVMTLLSSISSNCISSNRSSPGGKFPGKLLFFMFCSKLLNAGVSLSIFEEGRFKRLCCII